MPTPDGSDRLTVRIWRDDVDVALCDTAINAALSRWLGAPLRLVHIDRPGARTANPAWAAEGSPVSLADGYPILVATLASLRALNRSIVLSGGDPVPMSRFRPNLVIDDAEPFAEDGWATLRIGEAVLDLVKPCARCTVTTVDQAAGTIAGDEPLASLRHLRMSADRRVPGVLFGWNAVPRGAATVALGDPVVIEAIREAEVVRQPQAPASAGR